MSTVSLLIFLVISAAWFCGVRDCWISAPSIEWVKSELGGALRYSESVVTWLDSEGSALLGSCEEYEEPDRDLYYPDVKHCARLSDRLSGTADVLLAYWARAVQFLLTIAPDTSKLFSALDTLRRPEILVAVKESVSSTPEILESFFIYAGNSLQDTYISVRSQNFELPSCERIKEWFQQFPSEVVLFNRTSLTLTVTVSCLTLIYVVCYVISDTDFAYSSKKVTFSTDNSAEDSSTRRAQRLARIRPTHTAKKDKGKRKKRQRQRPTSRDTSTDPESCSLNSSFSPRPGSESNGLSHIDDETLRYIVGGATDTSSEDLKERIRAALQVLACHEDEECNTKSGREGSSSRNGSEECPGTVEYDIRYKDNLPSDVMDVLFCIDPKCEHDHGRYELRGCKIRVKPASSKNSGKRPKSGSRKSSYSTSKKSPIESNKHSFGQGTDDDSRHHDKDPSTQRADSFPDWTAPAFDQCCPYCKMSEKEKKGEVSAEEEGLYSEELTSESAEDFPGDVSSKRPHSNDVSGPHPRRPQPELIELLGEAALEQVIGPPQANSSFQAEDEISRQKFTLPSAKIYIHSMDSSPTESLRPGKRGVGTEYSPIYDPKKSGVQSFAYATSVKSRPDEPIVSVKWEGTPGRDDTSKEYDSVPTFNEAELSLTRELQDSYLNDSQNSIDLAELNRSLSFYGDVSMAELAASWIVNNILDRARNMISQVKVGSLKDSVMNISTEIMEKLDLLE